MRLKNLHFSTIFEQKLHFITILANDCSKNNNKEITLEKLQSTFIHSLNPTYIVVLTSLVVFCTWSKNGNNNDDADDDDVDKDAKGISNKKPWQAVRQADRHINRQVRFLYLK